MGERYTCEQIIDALNQTKGVYLAANLLGCSHQTVYNYIDRHPSVAQAWEQIDGETTDYAAVALREAIRSGESWAIQFQLRTKGQKRGYADKDTNISGHITIEVVYDDDSDPSS